MDRIIAFILFITFYIWFFPIKENTITNNNTKEKTEKIMDSVIDKKINKKQLPKDSTINEFIRKYGKVKVIFYSYYKYVFIFKGEFQGKIIYVEIGGLPEFIYNFIVMADVEKTIEDLFFEYSIVKGKNKILKVYSEKISYYSQLQLVKI